MGDFSRNESVRKVGYARVSTTDQNPDMQIEALKRYGVREEFIFVDHASGGSMERPEFLKALREAQYPGSEFVVWKLDRLGRTMKGVLETLELLTSRGIAFVSLTERIDTTGPMGKAMIHLLAVFAELERDLISERTKAGLARARERGAAVGRPEAMTPERVEEAMRMVGEGAATSEIVARLQQMDPPPISKSKVYAWVKDYKASLAGPDTLAE